MITHLGFSYIYLLLNIWVVNLKQIFDFIININKSINEFVWITVGIPLLLFVGILITILTKGFQIKYFKHIFKSTVGKIFSKKKKRHTADSSSISQFQALCTALASTIGIGNITGVSAAILTGGPGAIFWMWVAAFLGMMTIYAENVLGIYFRRKNAQGEWSGGAMYYLQDGVGKLCGLKKFGKALAVLFSFFTVLAAVGVGNMAQVNTIINNFTSAFNMPFLSDIVLVESGSYSLNLYTVIIAVLLMCLVAIIITGGLKRIAGVTEKVVPVMVILFVLGSISVILINYKNIFSAFKSIFVCAFNTNAAFGGLAGISVKFVIEQGFKRGMFTNEAGLGSSVMINSNSDVIEPARQGMWGIVEVFIDTIIMCTLTALVILTSGVIDLKDFTTVTNNSTLLVAEAFNSAFDFNIGFGKIFVALSVLLFAFSTILGWSHYGSKSIEYITNSNKAIKTYKILFILAVFIGAVIDNNIILDICDTFNGLMMIPNLIGVVLLLPLVLKITKNYKDRYIKKITGIKPILSYSGNIQNEQEAKLEIEEY